MTALFDNPLVQSALLPFVLALVFALIFGVLAPRWRGLALPLGFYPAAFLIAGMQLWPLTSTRKILLLGVMAVIVALILFGRKVEGRWRTILLSVFVVLAAGWVLWPLMLRTEGLVLLLLVGGSLIYMLWSVLLLDRQRGDVSSQLLSVCLFSTGIAIAAAIGASALLGQLAGGLAAVVGALLLLVMLSNKAVDDDLLLLPVTSMAALLGLAAVAYASLAWQSLLCLMAIPLVSRLPLTINSLWFKIPVQLLLMLIIMAGAVYLAWDDAGDSYY